MPSELNPETVWDAYKAQHPLLLMFLSMFLLWSDLLGLGAKGGHKGTESDFFKI